MQRFLGGQVSKPKKSVSLNNRPYIECSNSSTVKMGENNSVGYIKCEPSGNQPEFANDPGSRFYKDDYVAFLTNGLAKTISGDFYVSSDANKANKAMEGVLRIYDRDGKELYSSPIMRNSTAAQHFKADISDSLSVKLVFEKTTPRSVDSGDSGNPLIKTHDMYIRLLMRLGGNLQ